jgi:hypothetical protein
MPARWLERTYRGQPASLAAVRDIARRCESSLAATVVRGNGLLGWNRGFLRWRADEEGIWRLASWAGVPREMRGVLQTTAETRRTLNQVISGRDEDHILPLRVKGAQRQFPAELWISPRRRSAVALVGALH